MNQGPRDVDSVVDRPSFGEWLTERLADTDKSGRAAARELGVSQYAMRTYLHGEYLPGADKIDGLARLLDVPYEEAYTAVLRARGFTDTYLDADRSPAATTVEGVDFAELRELDPDGFAHVIDHARYLLERARAQAPASRSPNEI